MTTLTRIGDRLKALLPPDRGEQKALAYRAGVTPETLNKILRGKTKEPGFETIARLAKALGLSLDALYEGPLPPRRDDDHRRLAPRDRQKARVALGALIEILGLDERAGRAWPKPSESAAPGGFADVGSFPSRPDADGDFPPPPIPPGEFIEKDTDVPRPLHAWVVPVVAEAAAGTPREVDDVLVPTTQLLNTFREVHDPRTHVIRILGDSMHPILKSGWKVLIDPAKSLFQPGKIVMVYIRDEGSTIGRLEQEGEALKLVKRNPNYGGPVEIPLRAGEWYPVGTVTTVVEAQVEPDWPAEPVTAPIPDVEIDMLLAAGPPTGSLSAPVTIANPYEITPPRRKGEVKK